MHILIWLLATLALGLWTLLAWATAWVLGLDPASIGPDVIRLSDLPGAAWFDIWLPGWDGLVAALIALLRELFAAIGSIGPWLVWATWGLGALLIVGAASLGSVLIALARRATRPAPPLAGQA